MPLHITPDIMESVYETLRITSPFRGWRLPPGDDVVFSVLRTDSIEGDYLFERGQHRIRVSGTTHRTLHAVTMTVAHEMCHMRDQIKGVRSHHGGSFRRMADVVCRHHGFDRGQF
ncbi:MAG: hypothetical protein JWL86_506 [Rhizobium sp.]|nr:hypothetical protein [Rhizobium sp.]